MHPRFAAFPSALVSKARNVRLNPGNIPALLVHPDWERPAPTLLWFHGRTVTKELDPGRYLRLLRAGIATCAIDLPGHGERPGPKLHDPRHTIDVLAQGTAEIDTIIEALADPEYADIFDLDNLAIGGMSAGGMIALRRLCDPHPFSAALIEASSGSLAYLNFPPIDAQGRPVPLSQLRERIEAIDPARHLDTWQPLPLLAIHATTDQLIPYETQRAFIDDLRTHYKAHKTDPDQIELITYTNTGAPGEHAGFGKFGADAKTAATDFLTRHLLLRAPSASSGS